MRLYAFIRAIASRQIYELLLGKQRGRSLERVIRNAPLAEPSHIFRPGTPSKRTLSNRSIVRSFCAVRCTEEHSL